MALAAGRARRLLLDEILLFRWGNADICLEIGLVLLIVVLACLARRLPRPGDSKRVCPHLTPPREVPGRVHRLPVPVPRDR